VNPVFFVGKQGILRGGNKRTENIHPRRPRGHIPPKAGQHRRESSRIPKRPLRFRKAPVPDPPAQNRTAGQIGPDKVFSDANRWKDHCLMMSCLGRDVPPGPQPIPSCGGTHEQKENPAKLPLGWGEDPYFLRPFWISLGISNSQGTFVWQRPQPVIFTPYSGLLSDPTV